MIIIYQHPDETWTAVVSTAIIAYGVTRAEMLAACLEVGIDASDIEPASPEYFRATYLSASCRDDWG
jgi:hypothetical protein